MTEQMFLKIAKPLPGEREPIAETAKRLKTAGDYTDTGWEVLGVPYGGPLEGRDTDGQAFHPGTDIWLKAGDSVKLTYYHGFGPDQPGEMQPTPVQIGEGIYARSDERGHWFDILLDDSEPLAQRLMAAGAENIKASSGAVGHLVRMGKANLLDVWPVGELALFDTNEWRRPANEYAVCEMKRLIDTPEAGEAVDAIETVESLDVEIQEPIKTIKLESVIMDEETKVVESNPVLDELKAMRAELAAMKAESPVFSAPAIKKVTEPGFTQDATKGFIHWCATGQENGALIKAAMQGQTDSEGGYAVPDDFYARIVEKASLMSFIRQTAALVIQTSLDVIRIPAEGTTATKFVITAEEGAVDENEPTLGDVKIELHNLTKLIKASKQLLADNKANLEGYFVSLFARSKAMAENYYFTVGTGTGMPLGVLAGASTSGIDTGTNIVITGPEVVSLIGSLGAGYSSGPGCGFLGKNATKWYLKGIQASPFSFIDTPATGEFVGYPFYVSDDMEAIAQGAKALLFGNFNYYAVAERQGMEVQRLVELYAANQQVGLLANFRLGGTVLQSEAFKYLNQKNS